MWPWDWVIAAGNAVSGLSQKVVDWVSSLISSVTSWVSDAIDSIWKGINQVWRDIASVWDQLMSFVNTVAQQVWNGINHLASTISGWVNGLVNDIWHAINGMYDWAVRELERLGSLIDTLWNDVVRWVQTEVWDPLMRLYEDVKNWALQLFDRVWQYIQHPELLISLVGGYLLHMWLQYAIRFASVFTKWIMKAMRSMAGEVFDLLESVISSII